MNKTYKLLVSLALSIAVVGSITSQTIMLDDIREELETGTQIAEEILETEKKLLAIEQDILELGKGCEPPEQEMVETDPPPVVESNDILTQEEIELIALVTMAEAEAEPEEGQRLVIDTILNRVDSPYFPDTVYDVIWQKNQFTSMTNGRADRCYPREDLCELVKEELEYRYNYDVIFFRTTRYSDYGVPLFQVGHHYFSSYN